MQSHSDETGAAVARIRPADEREQLQDLTPKLRGKLAATLRSLLIDLGDVPEGPPT